MSIYLDSSALVKLVIVEAESTALRTYLRTHRSRRISCDLARVEVIRAVAQNGAKNVAMAKQVLHRLHSVSLARALIDTAAGLGPAVLRSPDAIHLAAAMQIPDLESLITYDQRMLDAANQLGIPTARPT